MSNPWQDLQVEFAKDHRLLIRGYRQLIDLLNHKDYDAAAAAAVELNQLAGAHIEFEEQHLYPAVGASRGDQYLSRLYHEHDEFVSVIREICQCGKSVRPTQKNTTEWIAQLKSGIDHASACGNLLADIRSQPDARLTQWIHELHRLRALQRPWTDLGSRPSLAW